jgi:hypothetical protein
MRNIRKVQQEVSMGYKSAVMTAEVGNLFGDMCDRFRESCSRSKLTDVALTNKGYNLFSCTKMQQKGWTQGGDQKSIWLQKDNSKIVFDIPIHTPKGVVFAAYIRREIGSAGVASMEGNTRIEMPYEEAHDILGHIGEDGTRKMAKYLGWI